MRAPVWNTRCDNELVVGFLKVIDMLAEGEKGVVENNIGFDLRRQVVEGLPIHPCESIISGMDGQTLSRRLP